ncbi:hypothetical protein AB4254_08665 [Vibrio breoganii]
MTTNAFLNIADTFNCGIFIDKDLIIKTMSEMDCIIPVDPTDDHTKNAHNYEPQPSDNQCGSYFWYPKIGVYQNELLIGYLDIEFTLDTTFHSFSVQLHYVYIKPTLREKGIFTLVIDTLCEVLTEEVTYQASGEAADLSEYEFIYIAEYVSLPGKKIGARLYLTLDLLAELLGANFIEEIHTSLH